MQALALINAAINAVINAVTVDVAMEEVPVVVAAMTVAIVTAAATAAVDVKNHPVTVDVIVDANHPVTADVIVDANHTVTVDVEDPAPTAAAKVAAALNSRVAAILSSSAQMPAAAAVDYNIFILC
jgi:hypothetical protein